YWMFDDYIPLFCGCIVNRVCTLADLVVLLNQNSIMHDDMVQVLRIQDAGELHLHSLIDSVREQPLFLGMNRIEQTFSRKLSVFEDRETSAIEREIARVC